MLWSKNQNLRALAEIREFNLDDQDFLKLGKAQKSWNCADNTRIESFWAEDG